MVIVSQINFNQVNQFFEEVNQFLEGGIF